jgi:hypothetical protein
MRAYWKVQTELELFLNSAPDRGEGSPLRAFVLPTGKVAPVPVEQGGSQCRSRRVDVAPATNRTTTPRLSSP